MLATLAASILRHRRWWTGALLLVLAGALVLSSRLSLRHQASDFLPRNQAPDTTGLTGLGGADRVVVVLESDRTIPVAEAGPVLDRLAERLASIPGVRRVEHRLRPEYRRFLEEQAPRYLAVFFDSTQLEDLGRRLSRAGIERALLHSGEAAGRSRLAESLGAARTDPLGILGIAARLLRPAGGDTHVRFVDGYFAVPDHRVFFLTLEPERSLTDIASARGMVGAIDRELASTRQDPVLRSLLLDKRLFAVGRPVAYVQGFDVAFADAKRVGVASTITVFLLLLIFLRRPVAPLLIMGTVLYGLVLTAAVAYLLFGSISLVGWLFIAVLVGLGDEFGLYIVSHYWISARATGDRAEALASALRRPGPGILLGGLTSAGAFVSLVALSYPVMTQLGWITSIGLLLLLLASFTVLPLALSFTRPGQVPESRWFRWPARFHYLGQGRRTWSLLFWLGLVLLSLWMARRVPFEPHPWNVVVRGHPATALLDSVQRRLGAGFTPILMVSRAETADSALALDRAATLAMDRVRFRAGVAATVSLSRWLPPIDRQRRSAAYVLANAESFSPDRFRRDFAAVQAKVPTPDSMLTVRYAPLIAGFLDPDPQLLTLDRLRELGLGDLVDQHLVERDGEYLAISQVYLTRLPWSEGVIDRFLTTVHERGGPALEQVTFVSDALRGATHSATLRRDIALATGIALALVLGVLAARFRRVMPVLLCLVPLVCGISVALGAMALLHIELNILTLTIAPLLVGLGVDDGIHMMDRLTRGESPLEVIRETGAAMTITTLTTIAGFACLAFATFRGVRELGLIAALGLLVCLGASLHLLPICYELTQGGNRRE